MRWCPGRRPGRLRSAACAAARSAQPWPVGLRSVRCSAAVSALKGGLAVSRIPGLEPVDPRAVDPITGGHPSRGLTIDEQCSQDQARLRHARASRTPQAVADVLRHVSPMSSPRDLGPAGHQQRRGSSALAAAMSAAAGNGHGAAIPAPQPTQMPRRPEASDLHQQPAAAWWPQSGEELLSRQNPKTGDFSALLGSPSKRIKLRATWSSCRPGT